MKNIKDLNNLVFKQLEFELSKNKQKLPKTGIVAGQSVSSIICKILNVDINYVINDIDIFQKATEVDRNKADMQKKSSFVSNISKLRYEGYEDGDYERPKETVFKTIQNGGYYLVRALRDGLINYIKVSATTFNIESIIEGFDLNAVQVGIDIETKELIGTQYFWDFIKSKELELVNTFTPSHSIIRYFKKKKELGCYGNDEYNASIVAFAIYFNHCHKWEDIVFKAKINTITPNIFGTKYREMYDSVSEEISKYFYINYQVSYLNRIKPKLDFLNKILNKFSKVRENIIGYDDTEKVASNLIGKYSLITSARNYTRQALGYEKLDKNELTNIKNKGLEHIENFYYLNPNYTKQEKSLKAMVNVNKFVEKNYNFSGLFSGLCLNEQNILLKALNPIIKNSKEPEYIILQSVRFFIKSKSFFNGIKLEEINDAIKEIMKDIIESENTELTEVLPEIRDFFCSKIKFHLLNTEYEIKKYGAELNICLKNEDRNSKEYINDVSNNKILLYKVSFENTNYVVELEFNKRNKLVISQIKGYNNEPANSEINEATKFITKEIQEIYLKNAS